MIAAMTANSSADIGLGRELTQGRLTSPGPGCPAAVSRPASRWDIGLKKPAGWRE